MVKKELVSLLQLLCLVLLLYPLHLYALQINYGVDVGVSNSDNITRVNENPISGVTQEIGVQMDLKHTSDVIGVTFLPRITYYNYVPVELEDRTLYSMDSTLLWKMVKSRLSWSIEDYIEQTAIDVTAAETAFNKQTTNVFLTGPNLKFDFEGGKRLVFLARYADFYYEIDDTVDNERVGGLLQLINQASPTMTYSLNYSSADIRYKDQVVNEDYIRNDIFLGLNQKGNRYDFSLDAGYSVLDREFSEELDGLLAKFNIAIQLNTKSSLTIYGNSEYTDSSRSFLLSRYYPTEFRRFSTAISADILYEKSILVAYRWSDLVSTIDLQYSHTEQDYEEEATDELDRSLKIGSIYLTRRMSRLIDAILGGSWTNTYYKTTLIEDNDQFYYVGMNFRLSRSLLLRIDYNYANRDSTDVTGNYTENRVFAGISFRR